VLVIVGGNHRLGPSGSVVIFHDALFWEAKVARLVGGTLGSFTMIGLVLEIKREKKCLSDVSFGWLLG
jgi:hypothetical protein